MKHCYVPHRFSQPVREMIDASNTVITEWQRQGYRLTLRQLYYRLVSKNIIANTVKEYKHLGNIIVQARRAGEVDWDALEDRTRNLMALRNWEDPKSAMKWLSEQYHTDMWANQPCRVEVWFEKDALAGIFERACTALDVPFFSCRGYNSESEMWRGAMRLAAYENQAPVILHFGDHDPSGIDMTRDIADRMKVFGVALEIDRMALNIDQVKKHCLPPNPARETDSRFQGYIKKFGKKSWELDALEPSVLANYITNAVTGYRSEKKWKIAVARERREKRLIKKMAEKI